MELSGRVLPGMYKALGPSPATTKEIYYELKYLVSWLLELSLSQQDDIWCVQRLGLNPQHLRKPNLVVDACNISTLDLEARTSRNSGSPFAV